MYESYEIRALWDWLLQNAGRLNTHVIFRRIEVTKHLSLRLTCPVTDQPIAIDYYGRWPSINEGWSYTGNISPTQVLEALQDSLTPLPDFARYQFYQHTIAFCEMNPVYLDQLLARLEYCEECCSYAINTVTWELYNLLRCRIQERLDEILPKQLAA